MRISIVMTYYNRQEQLNKTLLSISESKHKEFEVIIVDDNSDNEIILPSVQYPIHVIRITDKKWINPEPAYNTGILKAFDYKPEIIILQNAECYHIGDIISYSENVTDESYISFACFSIGQQETQAGQFAFNESPALSNGDTAWYNHSIYRPVFYDFCSAITAKNLIKLNGYDERFSAGCAYGDDYLIKRIRMLGLRAEIINNPLVIHQWHYINSQHPDQENLVKRNSDLLASIQDQNNFRAEHIYTKDFI